MWACRIRPLGAEIVIGCDDALSAALAQHVSPWEPETCHSPPHAVLLAVEGPRPFGLRVGSDVLHTSSSLDGLMVRLQNWIDAVVTKADTGLIAVHAGVVGWKGSASLRPGTSGSGKTTLVRALIERGASYYSDELAFVDAQGRAHPYPRHTIVRDAQGVGRPCAIRRAVVASAQAAPVGLIAGLQFDMNADWQVARIPASEALLLMLANTAHRLSPNGVPPALLRASATACSYMGKRGDADAASAAILALCESARQ